MILDCNNILQYSNFYCVFDQINAGLVRNSKSLKKILIIRNFCPAMYIIYIMYIYLVYTVYIHTIYIIVYIYNT